MSCKPEVSSSFSHSWEVRNSALGLKMRDMYSMSSVGGGVFIQVLSLSPT